MMLSALGLPQIALATDNILPPDVIPPDLQNRSVDPLVIVQKGLQWLMYAVGIISVVMIIMGGIRYATSGGNAEKVKTAKNTILYACVGLAVALLSLAIVTLINTNTGNLGG